MSHYTSTDQHGQTDHIYVNSDNRVLSCNNARIRTSLNTYSITAGRAAGDREIRDAARNGLAALNNASFYSWTQA